MVGGEESKDSLHWFANRLQNSKLGVELFNFFRRRATVRRFDLETPPVAERVRDALLAALDPERFQVEVQGSILTIRGADASAVDFVVPTSILEFEIK